MKRTQIPGALVFRAANVFLILTMLLAAVGVRGVEAARAGTALQFNGSNQYVLVPNASGLNTATFTVELWFKRTGDGVGVTTGSGGITLAIPLVAKGTSEAENANADVNYFFGIDATSGKLVADFEEAQGQPSPSLNHPITAGTLVTRDIWHHAAVTYDGTTWKIYLDGTVDGTLSVGRTPNTANIGPVGIATSIRSNGTTIQGYFAGIIDEVRIWNYARSQAEISTSYYSELTSETGLLARWGMNEGSGASIASSVGTFPGTLTNGPTWVNGFPLQPVAPSGLSATPGDASTSLSWSADSDPDTAGYNLYRGTIDGGPYLIKVNPTLITGTSRTDTGLTNGTTYYYILKAVNIASVESAASAQASATPINAAPGAPTGFAATPGNTTVSLSWTANPESDMSGYNVYRSEISGGPYSKVNGSLVTATNYSDPSLVNGTAYYYVITAVDTGLLESGNSSEVSATPFVDTTPPAAPTGLAATVQLGQIRLDWTAPGDPDLNGFNVYRGTSSPVSLVGPLNGGTPLSKTTLNYTDTTVVKDTTYYYVVTAVDSSLNESTASNEVNGKLAAALSFDGTNDYVTFGPASGLNMHQFTLETWFYWTGGGTTASTGTGGISAIPLITKGRGESESATYNVNYFLGINGGKLAADFEAFSGGANYPVTASTTITQNTWHHAAVTYDGTCWNIYLDGKIEMLTGSTICPGIWSDYNSIQHAALGTALNSSGVAEGYFAGRMDEVRIWNVALSQAQIRAEINNQLSSGTGLVARWNVDEGKGTVIASSIGSFPGTLINGTAFTSTAPFNLTLDTTPPAIPADLAAAPGNTTIGLSWSAVGDSDLYSYRVYRSTMPGVPTTSPVATIVKPTVAYTDTGRSNGQIYYYVITAVDTSGNESGASNEVNATPVGSPPTAPSGLTVTADATNYSIINLGWTDNSSDETGFEVERSTTGIGGTYSLINTTAANAVSYKNISLSPATLYCYRVRAVNANGPSGYTSSLCATTVAEGDHGLQFNGSNQYVTFGPTTSLGAQNFTIETWFKRTGNGVAVSTGSNGISMVPLVAKGAPEADGSSVDENYVLGISSTGNYLAGDFETYALCGIRPAGDNNPIVGITPIVNDIWYHAAFTYDGTALKLYLNGNLEQTLASTCIPRYDNTQPAALGTMLTSGNNPNGYFAGILDEVRIWNFAKTQSEIRATINAENPGGTGLVARWGLNEGTDTVANSSVGSFPGTLTNGPTWITPGAPYNITFDTTPPAAPTGLYAIGASASVSLDWADNAEPDLAGYNVYRGTVSGVYSKVNSSIVTSSSYIDSGLTNGTEYYYVVRAVDNSANESTDSNEAYVIPQVEAGSALQFTTTTGTYVTFGDPAKLDLATFTIETWFKRTGTGTPNTTGTDGFASALPLVTHGSPEAEGGTVDANWMLVINDATDVIGFDFEDMATGGNHPLSGVTPIVDNVWHHAAATFDGTTVKLYLDGKLENSLVPGALPRSDTTQQAALGTMLTTTGTANGFFQGVLDEARVWNRALTQTEILTNLNHQVTTGSGLVARWGLNEGTGTAVGDSLGTPANGTITGTGYTWVPGAPFNINLAPNAPTLVSPLNLAADVPISTNLTVHVTDSRNASQTVYFYGRPKIGIPGTDFSLIAIPDPQYYAANTPSIYNAQMNWVVTNKTTLDIPFVVSLGDNVNTATIPSEWTNATTAWDILATGGVPYGLTAGNHDGAPSSTSNFNTYFGSRLSSEPEFGGRYGTSDYDNTYFTFTGDGMQFIVIFIEYDSAMTSTSNPVLVWANGILTANSMKRAIVVTHDLLNGNSFSTQGQAIYDALKSNANLFLMLGGHLDTTGQRTDIYQGHTVYSLRSDYQFVDSQASGYLRIMRFSPANDKIYVSTYSPTQTKYLTDASNQFELAYAMNPVPEYSLIGTTTVSSGSDASISWPGLTNSTEYEWYAVTDNGGGSAVSSTWSFTTAAPANIAPIITEGDPAAVNMAKNGSPMPFSLTLNATDADLDTLTWSVATPASHGSAAATGTGLSQVVTYTPTTDYLGSDNFVVQVSDGRGGTDTITVNVTINPVHGIDLVAGWNMVSFNLHPLSTSLTDVLKTVEGNYDLVYAYDSSVPTDPPGNNWLKADNLPETTDTLTQLDESRGFWIHMTTPDILEVVGTVVPTHNITLHTDAGGWNLVSYPGAALHLLPDALLDHGVGTNYTLIYAYQPGSGDPWKIYDRTAPAWVNTLAQFDPGWSYWIFATPVESTWAVPN